MKGLLAVVVVLLVAPALQGRVGGGTRAVQCLSLVFGYQKDIWELELIASLSFIIFVH